MTLNAKFQIIIIYMIKEILNVRCSKDNRLHMLGFTIANHIYKHISFDPPNNPMR